MGGAPSSEVPVFQPTVYTGTPVVQTLSPGKYQISDPGVNVPLDANTSFFVYYNVIFVNGTDSGITLVGGGSLVVIIKPLNQRLDLGNVFLNMKYATPTDLSFGPPYDSVYGEYSVKTASGTVTTLPGKLTVFIPTVEIFKSGLLFAVVKYPEITLPPM